MAKSVFSHLVENRPGVTGGKGYKLNRQPLHSVATPRETLNPLSTEEPLGYTTGTGGTVTQGTSKATGVTLNKLSGQITTHVADLATVAAVSFTLTNSNIGANDVVTVNIKSGATVNSYIVGVTAVAAGSCQIQIYNLTGGTLGEVLVLNFSVFKGSSS